MTPPPSSTTDRPAPASDIAEIAELFLSQTRANTAPTRARPVRIPPGSPRIPPAAEAQPPIEQAPSATVDEVSPASDVHTRTEYPAHPQRPALGSPAALPAHLLVAPHISPERLPTFAGQVAGALYAGARVGLLIPRAGLYLLDASLPPDHSGVDVAASEKVVAEHVQELGSEVDAWLVAATDLDADWELLALAPEWLVPADTTAQPTTIAAYATLKSLAPLGDTPIRLATFTDPAKLLATTAQFLARDIAHLPLAPDSPALHPLLTYPNDLRQTALSLLQSASNKTIAPAAVDEPQMDSPLAEDTIPADEVAAETRTPTEPAASPQRIPLSTQPPADVLDLLSSALDAILAAHPEWTEIDSPLDPTPLHPTTRLVQHNNTLTLVATAASVEDLTTLAARLTWVATTAPLLHRLTNTPDHPIQTRLYLDHTLLALTPLLSANIHITPTRSITWTNRAGLLLPPRQAA